MTWTVDLWRMSRVLVVDDDPNLRHLVSVRLQKAGHRVLVADSAAEALAVVQDRGAPDVVVLDVTMPGHDRPRAPPGHAQPRRLRGAAGDLPLRPRGPRPTSRPAARWTRPTSRSRSAPSRWSTRSSASRRSKPACRRSPLRGVAGREVRPAAERAVVARPARAVLQRLLEPVERAEAPPEVVDHVHERRLARARDHR